MIDVNTPIFVDYPSVVEVYNKLNRVSKEGLERLIKYGVIEPAEVTISKGDETVTRKCYLLKLGSFPQSEIEKLITREEKIVERKNDQSVLIFLQALRINWVELTLFGDFYVCF